MPVVSQSFVNAELKVDRAYARGDKGRKVTTIQQWLSLHGHGVMVDGAFGPATEAAVADFQKEAGLARTGKVNQRTFSALVAPMSVVLEPMEPNGRTLPQLVLAHAKQHLEQNPREIGGQNMGPWVRLYMKGKEGKDWPWCAGFVSTIVAQAAESLSISMPFTPTFSCDVLASRARDKGLLFTEADVANDIVPRKQFAGGIFIRKRTAADWDHTGLIVAVHADHMETIEGNTNDAGDREGYEVCRRRRGLKAKDFVRLS